MAEKNSHILRIAVFPEGRFTVDGAPSSIPELRQSLRKLAGDKGVVWYYREDGQQPPPAVAKEILDEIIALGLPIRLSAKPDYSDVVGR